MLTRQKGLRSRGEMDGMNDLNVHKKFIIKLCGPYKIF